MKKNLVIAMFALTMSACSSIAGDMVETSEIVIPISSLETENKIAVETIKDNREIVIETEVRIEHEELPEDTKGIEGVQFGVIKIETIKYAKSSVNVRKGPSTDYEKIGMISANQMIKVIGQADTGWYQIELAGESGYVSDKYLVDEKVAVNTTSESNTNSGIVTNTGNESILVDYATSTLGADSDNIGEYVVSEPETEWVDDWGEPDFVGGGDGNWTPTTDGYGSGVEIEITPTP